MTNSQPNLCYTILELTDSMLSSFDLINDCNNTLLAENRTVDNDCDDCSWPSAKGINELLLCISCLKNLTVNDLKSLALKTLNIANLPIMIVFDKSLYEKFLRKLLMNNSHLNVLMSDLIGTQTERLIDLTTRQNNLSKVSIICYFHVFLMINFNFFI